MTDPITWSSSRLALAYDELAEFFSDDSYGIRRREFDDIASGSADGSQELSEDARVVAYLLGQDTGYGTVARSSEQSYWGRAVAADLEATATGLRAPESKHPWLVQRTSDFAATRERRHHFPETAAAMRELAQLTADDGRLWESTFRDIASGSRSGSEELSSRARDIARVLGSPDGPRRSVARTHFAGRLDSVDLAGIANGYTSGSTFLLEYIHEQVLALEFSQTYAQARDAYQSARSDATSVGLDARELLAAAAVAEQETFQQLFARLDEDPELMRRWVFSDAAIAVTDLELGATPARELYERLNTEARHGTLLLAVAGARGERNAEELVALHDATPSDMHPTDNALIAALAGLRGDSDASDVLSIWDQASGDRIVKSYLVLASVLGDLDIDAVNAIYEGSYQGRDATRRARLVLEHVLTGVSLDEANFLRDFSSSRDLAGIAMASNRGPLRATGSDLALYYSLLLQHAEDRRRPSRSSSSVDHGPIMLFDPTSPISLTNPASPLYSF